ncbi:MAG: GNAT family N-acetyltransferase [Spartobacteria bacterium]
MQALVTETVRGRKAAFALEKEYIELFESLPNANVFFSPEWVYSWLLSLGRRYEVCFITCRDAGRLVGVWPFFEHRIPLVGTSLLPVGAQAADLFDPVATEDAMGPLVDALCELCRNYAFAWMPLLSVRFAKQELQPAMESSEALHFLRKRTERFLVELDRFNSFEDFMQIVFGPKTRQSLRRKTRRLEEKGTLKFQTLQTPEEISPWITKAMQLEKVSWKGEEGVGIFKRATHRAFYHLLMETLASRGRLRLSLLTLNNELAAYEIGILGTDNYCMHGTAFDPALASFSPGRLLMLHVLEKCIDEKRRIYDFLQNDQEFKRQMSTHASSFWDWIVLPRSPRGWLLLLVVRTMHTVSEWKRRRAQKIEKAQREAAANKTQSPAAEPE